MIVTLIVLAHLAYKTYLGYKTGFTRYIIGLICSAIVFMVAISCKIHLVIGYTHNTLEK